MRNAYSNCIAYAYSNAHTYSYADAMQWEMFTHAAAVPDFGWPTYSALSLNTAAYCFTERHPSTAAHAAADACGLAASNSRPATVRQSDE